MEDDALGGQRRIRVATAGELSLTLPLSHRHTVSTILNARGEVIADRGRPAFFLPSVRATAHWNVPFHKITLSLTPTVGTGYRLPSFSELFWPANAFARGNPDLDPEHALSAELSAELTHIWGWNLRLTGHGTFYRDLIQWIASPGGTWSPRNTQSAYTAGTEVSTGIERPIGYSAWEITVELSGEYLLARSLWEGTNYNNRLPYRPELSAVARVAASHLDGYTLSAHARWVAAQPVNAANTVWLDRYLDVSLSSHLSWGRWQGGLSISNLLNWAYTTSRFAPNPGREITLYVESSW